MSHRCTFVSTVSVEDNRIWIYTWAQHDMKQLDVYKVRLDDGKAYVREGNLVFKNMGGWLVDFPEETVRASWYYGYGRHKAELYDYVELKDRIRAIESGYDMQQPAHRIRKLLLNYYPELKYLIKKLEDQALKNPYMLIDIIKTYKEHPESENLFAMGFYEIANNKTLYRLSKPKKTQIINFLRQLDIVAPHNYKLKEIQRALKLGIDVKLWQDMTNFYQSWYYRASDTIDYSVSSYHTKVYRYCMNKGIQLSYFQDIKQMVSQLGHDTQSDYWVFPNNPVKMHERLSKQIENQKQAQAKRKLEMLPKIAKANLEKPMNFDGGYQLFIPTKYEEFEACKTLLHQCLLSADYIGKMARGGSLIVMLWKDGKPSSTAEIDYKGNLLQFYGNEWNRNDCKPKQEEYKILESFMHTFKPKKLNKYLRG